MSILHPLFALNFIHKNNYNTMFKHFFFLALLICFGANHVAAQPVNPCDPASVSQLQSELIAQGFDCLQNAGRIGSYKDTILYSTLMPCFLCSGAAVQFAIPKVIVGESLTFPGAPDFMRAQGIEVVDLNLAECSEMMRDFIAKNPKLWNEDIGEE